MTDKVKLIINKTCPNCVYFIATKIDMGICNILGSYVLIKNECIIKPSKFKLNKKIRKFKED